MLHASLVILERPYITISQCGSYAFGIFDVDLFHVVDWAHFDPLQSYLGAMAWFFRLYSRTDRCKIKSLAAGIQISNSLEKPDFTVEIFLCRNFNEESIGCKKFWRASYFKLFSIIIQRIRLPSVLHLAEISCWSEILVSVVQKFTFAKCWMCLHLLRMHHAKAASCLPFWLIPES